jgi:RNA polymerase primary sigma factor
MASDDTTGKNDDAPLIDLNEASIKKLLAKAKRKGYITYDELNDALPQGEMSSDQIEDIQSAISEMGVQIVESDEDAGDEDGEKEAEKDADEDEDDAEAADTNVPEKKRAAGVGERTDDPVRMYLREMGAVELLSREGEIAIAKRIEAGRDTMIMGLCESPITFHAIITWSESLNSGEMQLREILDLDAMLSKEPPVDKMEEGAEDDDEEPEISEATAGPTYKEEDEPEEEPEEELDEDGEPRTRRREEEDEEDNTMSLAQMEAALKPEALERFARITDLFKTFERLQAERVDVLGRGEEFPKAKEKKYRSCASN